MSSKCFRAEVEIDAPASRVWSVLVDLPRYGEWNPFTVSMTSTLTIGGPIDMRVRMSRWSITIPQREEVREVRAPEGSSAGRLVWGATMPGVIAQRVQTVTPISETRSRYVTEDTIEGWMGGLVFSMFGGSLDDGFAGVARELKRRAETST
jgi:uncharacterized protein YndB with AHSA1/START domain